MNFTVSDDVVWSVVELADRDENPLGIDDPMRNQDAVDEAVKHALTGVDAATAARMAASLQRLLDARPDPTCDIDMITAELLAHLGVDPLTVAWLSAASRCISVQDDDDMDTVIDIDSDLRPHECATQCSTTTTLGATTWWKAGGVLLVKDLPGTVVANAVGRPLREILSHPVLDRHDLVVATADLERGGFPAELDCHVPPMVATPQWLVSAFPREVAP